MHRLSMICLLLTLSTLLLMSPARAAGWTAKATTLDLIAGPGATAAFLAPDGSRFAYFKGKEVCLYSITGEKGDCAGLADDVGIDLDSVRWSPDGTKLAFSENFIITFRDSDIWVYDTETNTITDLTPTANRGGSLLSAKPDMVFTVDMIPQWASDSQSIYFVRYQFNKLGDAYPHFYKIGLKDTEPQEVGTIESYFPLSVYGFALSPDDSKIAYLRDTQNTQKNDGTWFFDLATKESKFAAAPVQDTLPWAYQFSPKGDLLLVIGVDKTGNMRDNKPETSPIYTIPVSGGRQQQLNNDTYVFSAGWGPEGSELAYATVDQLNPDKEGLYITSEPGKAGELVLPGRFIAPVPLVRTPITWASNNVLLLSQGPDFKLVVVQLSQS